MSAEFRFSPRPNRAAEIPWQSWGEEAFASARASNRPILLSLSAVWCHWCHVMDETTYSDPEVIARIAADFVAIRVDNDERPDINARYNMGGWPTTAFLSCDGAIISGATYLPPPAMRQALDRIARFYAEQGATIDAAPPESKSHERDERLAAEIDGADVRRIVFEYARQAFDTEFGGFGDAQKFPHCELLEFLFEDGRLGNTSADAMLSQTLRAMVGGGTYDHVEGGFFRYSTTRDWSVPHFEKMAEDHGALLRILARVLACSEDSALQLGARSAVDYVQRTLYDARRGVFFGSQDADEEYFALDKAARARSEAPFVDPTSYTAWSAALAGAFAQLSLVLADPELAAIARRVLDRIDERLLDPTGLAMRLWRIDESPRGGGLLCDQSATIAANLDAYEALGEPRFLDRAENLTTRTLEAFAPEGGAAYDRLPDSPALGRLALQDRPMLENTSLAISLLRLAQLCERPTYEERARSILAYFSGSFQRAGLFAAAYARASTRLALRPALLVIEADGNNASEWRRAALGLGAPNLAVRSTPDSKRQVAYLCIGTLCGAPLQAPSELAKAYRTLQELAEPPSTANF
ncbi:MAG TPA: DUF255 domain-containing protein, partial [Candidatus Dormibacteraeota bacterium]|nr:DUF255 domain-containing protein [Candidatus Dormibacteraeota bacterium]